MVATTRRHHAAPPRALRGRQERKDKLLTRDGLGFAQFRSFKRSSVEHRVADRLVVHVN